jgi:hypothetical protein
MNDNNIQGKIITRIGDTLVDSSDDICKAVLLYDTKKICVFKREESIEVIDVNNDDEDYSVDTPVRQGNVCYKTYPHCRLCCGCADYEHVDGSEKLEFQNVGVSSFEKEFCVSYGTVVGVYYECGTNRYEEYTNIDKQDWFIVGVCYIAKDLIALCDDDSNNIIIYDSELSSEKGRINYKANEIVPLIKHEDKTLLCALDNTNNKCAFCNYSDYTVSTIIQFDETIIAGYELPQSDDLIAFIGNNSIYIVSLNTFQIVDTIYASNNSIKECGIVPNSDTICLLLDDNSICFVNCDTQDITDLVIDNNEDDQTITNIIAVDDNNLVIIKNDNTINVIEY